jgi:hypothetical protein
MPIRSRFCRNKETQQFPGTAGNVERWCSTLQVAYGSILNSLLRQNLHGAGSPGRSPAVSTLQHHRHRRIVAVRVQGPRGREVRLCVRHLLRRHPEQPAVAAQSVRSDRPDPTAERPGSRCRRPHDRVCPPRCRRHFRRHDRSRRGVHLPARTVARRSSHAAPLDQALEGFRLGPQRREAGQCAGRQWPLAGRSPATPGPRTLCSVRPAKPPKSARQGAGSDPDTQTAQPKLPSPADEGSSITQAVRSLQGRHAAAPGN